MSQLLKVIKESRFLLRTNLSSNPSVSLDGCSLYSPLIISNTRASGPTRTHLGKASGVMHLLKDKLGETPFSFYCLFGL